MKNFIPRSRQANERPITRKQKGFGAGAFDDIPSSAIPNNGVKYNKNYLSFEDREEPRGGTKKWSATTLPSLRTGYTLTKSGSTVTATVGAAFTAYDLGNSIVYDDGNHDLITGFTSSTVVTVGNSEARSNSTAAWVRGPYEWWIHEGKNKIVLHIDSRLFVSDPVTISWTQCHVNGPYRLSYNQSKCFDELDNFALIHNDNRIFKLNLDTNLFYPLNSREPTVKLTDIAKTALLPYGYKVVYSMARITGTGPNRDRETSDIVIELQSGPTKPDSTSGKDYAEIWTSRPIGEASTTYGVLTGSSSLPAAYDTVAEWEALSDFQFKITIDGTQRNCQGDQTGATSWTQVAENIELALRDAFSDTDSIIKCEWSTDHFVITSNTEGGTVTVTSAGDGGTDVGTAAMACEDGTGTLTTPTWTVARTIGTMTMPVDPADSGLKMSHWTHYVAWRILDMGENGIDPQSGDGNNKEQFIWEGDYPVAKAFTGSVISNQIISTTDIFVEGDVGDTVTFQDGTEVTVTSYTDGFTLGCSNANVASQSACFGGGSVITASQTGTTLTAASGHSFVEGDVGKVIFWANGLRSTITAFTSATVVTVAETLEVGSSAATFDAVSRTIQMTARDDYNGTSATIKQLRSRINGFSLPNRFWTALPSGCNTGGIVNGFLVTAERDERRYYYSQLPDYQEYLCGYYNARRQTGLIPDKIKFIIPFENEVAIVGSHSATGIPMNTFSQVVQVEGEVIFVITGQYEIDGKIGCVDWGSIAKINKQRYQMITSEPDCRYLERQATGRYGFSDSLAKRRILKTLQKTNQISSAGYDKQNGYLLWSSNRQKQIADEDLTWNLEFDEDEAYNFVLEDDDVVNLIL